MNSRIKLSVFIVIVILIMALGVYIAYMTLYKYELFVKIILSGWLLFLAYKEFFYNDSNSKVLTNIEIKFPRDLKHIPYFLMLSIVLGWGAMQFFDSIITLLRQVTR